MKYARFITFILTTLLLTAGLRADLVWTESGWQVEGGVLESYFGDKGEARNALDKMNVARSAQEKGSYFKALGLYKDVYKDYPGSIFAPEALFQAGKIRTARHQFEKAFENFDEIIERYPDYPKFNQVIGQQFEVASQMMEGKRPYFWGVIPGFKNLGAAMDYYEGVVENAPYSRYAPVSLMHIALIADKQGKTDEAIDALDRLITHYPDSVLAPDAYLNLARTYSDLVNGAYYDQGATREAISYFEDFLTLFPENQELATAEQGLQRMRDTMARSKFLIGKFYWNYRNDPEAAKVFLNEAITAAPKSKSAEEARSLLETIDSGAKPPSTPVDWLFGEYESPKTPEYKNETEEDIIDEDIPNPAVDEPVQ